MRFAFFPFHLSKVLRLPRKSEARSYEVLRLHVSCTSPATRNASVQTLCKSPTPAIVFRHAKKTSRFAQFWQGAESLAPATQNYI